VLFGNVPPPQANLLALQIYDTSFHNWNFGTGSAMSVLQLLFLLLVTAAYLLATNRRRKADA
jgi:multiple sugar transport system permease protein